MIETFWYREIESIHLDHGLEGGCWSKTFDYDAFSFWGRLGCEQVARASSFSASASASASSSASASASASASTPSFFLILLCPHASFLGCDVWMLDSDTPAEFCSFSFSFLFLVSMFLRKTKKHTL